MGEYSISAGNHSAWCSWPGSSAILEVTLPEACGEQGSGPLIPGLDIHRLFQWIAREVVREIDHDAEDPTDARLRSPD